MSPAASELAPYFVRYRGRFARGGACLVLAAGIQLLAPWVLKQAIDQVAAQAGAGAGAAGPALWRWAAGLVALALAGGVFRFLTRWIIIGASRAVECDLRNAFFRHLQRLPPGWFQGRRTGDLMSRATSDLSAVRMLAGPAIMYAASTSITFVAALALMISLSPALTLLALLPLPVVSVAVAGFGRAIYVRSDRIQAQLARMSAVVQEALAGVRVVRAYRGEAAAVERFGAANAEYLARSRALIRLQAAFHPTLVLCLGLSALIVLRVGSREVIDGRLTVGEFVAFTAYVAMLSWPVIAFGWVTNLLQRGLAAWRRMHEVLAVEPAIRDRPDPVRPAVIRGALAFRGLTFGYDDGRPVLSDVSAAVAPGQVLAVVGPTGAGKSTLVDLAPRLFDPPPGTVFIDGIDVRDLPLARLRAAIGCVPQEPVLFSDTVAENVAFGTGRPAAEIGDAVRAAVAAAGLDADVAGFPDGLDTEVGERGITLSGGQKQRVALARALLTDPRILILDDALSAVDTRTEAAILARLQADRGRRTLVLVAHRISTVRWADLILVLDGGRVVERGTHAALVAAGGLYAGLDRRQRLEAALDEA